MPSENYEHLLDAQQKKEAQEAAKKGNIYDTREKAVNNVLGKFDTPRDALEYLADLGNEDFNKKNTLEAKKASSGLAGPEQTELDNANARLNANQSVGAEVMRKLNQQANERRAAYQSKDFKDLQKDLISLKTSIDAAKRDLDQAATAYSGDPDKIKPYQRAFENAQSRFQEAEDIFKLRAPAEAAAAAEDEAMEAEEAKKNRVAELKALDAKKIFEKTSELHNEWNDLDKQVSTLRGRVRRGTATREQLAEAIGRQNSVYERWKEASDVLKEKEAEERKKLDEENENTARATLSSTEIEARRVNAEKAVGSVSSDLTTAEAELATAIAGGDATEIAKAQRKRNDLAQKLGEARKTLTLEEEALKNAKNRESRRTDATREIDTMELKSWPEYDALSPEQQAQYLEVVLAHEDMAGMNFNNIDNKIKNKLHTTFKERAFYGAEFAERMMSGKISQKEFPRLSAGNKDLHNMISQRVVSSEQAKVLAEKYGTTWEKMRNWALKDYRWLMILIALIAGVAGPATTVVTAGKLMMR